MRRKENITLNLQKHNTSFYRERKIITLTFAIIMLSFANIINTFALSYQTETDIEFTFNPTLSINISPADLIIDNLTPGTTDNSNAVNVSVATNSAYGYILTTSTGNNTTYNTTDLMHTSSNNAFSSLSTNANLTSLEDTSDNNIWGYSYKLSNSNTWSNYSGLPLYNSPLKVLINTDSNTETGPNSLDFKIAAKASTTQPSGAYHNVINFSAVTKPTPTTLSEAYASYYQATNKTMHNGYYVMQDMADGHICKNTEVINSELQVIDIRDDKVYWITKLADGHCWMTQNLDLNLIQNKAYTHADTDLGWDPNAFNVNITWILTTDPNWARDKYTPYYVDPGDKYVYTSNSDADDIIYDSLSSCTSAGHTDCEHYHIGNYYNWNAARANGDDNTSICPAGWRLPNLDSNEYGNLLANYNIIQNNTSTTYLENGFNNIRKAPLYFTRSGSQGDRSNTGVAPGVQSGAYFYNKTTTYASYINFNKTTINPIWNNQYYQIQGYGESVRCLAR